MTKKNSEVKVFKSIPSTENGNSVLCKTNSGTDYIISQNIEKMRFTLWKIVPSGYEKIGVEGSPLNFDELLYPNHTIR